MANRGTSSTWIPPLGRIRKNLWALLAAGVVVLSLLVPAEAVTIYSNLGTADSYDSASNVSLNVVARDIAFSFSVPGALTPFLIDSIEVPLQGSGSGDGITVSLTDSNSGGSEPGAILESSSVFIFGSQALRTATFSGTTLINSPGTYWVRLRLSSGSSANWFLNNTGALGDRAESTDNGASWTVSSGVTEAAFRVNGTVVPEPASLLLLGTGLAGLMHLKRKSKR